MMIAARPRPAARRLLRFCLLTIAAGAAVPARADFSVTSSSGTVTYTVKGFQTTTPTSPTTPIFNPSDNSLLYPGNLAYPVLGSVRGAAEVFSSTISPTTLSTVADAGRIGNPGEFGSASMQLIASTRGTGAGSLVQRTGIFYGSNSFAQSSGAEGVATVSISQATATFRNNGTTAVTALPGMLFNVFGSLSQEPGSFVEGALVGDILLPGASTPTSFNSLILAYGGPGTELHSGGGGGIFPSLDGLTFTATGSTNLASAITIAPGDSITIRSTLTLAADPNSIIRLESDLPPFLNLRIPTLGVFAGGVAPVPEPASIGLLAAGLLALGVVARARGRRAG
jgi:hypothetical protein